MNIPSIFEPGYFLDYSKNKSESEHIFCSAHNIQGALCPNCNKPLLKLASFDLHDKRLNISIKGVTQLPLLFCWTCNIAQGNFFYKILSNSLIKIIQFEEGGAGLDFPYKNYPLFFPEGRMILDEIPESIQKIICQGNSKELNWVDADDEFEKYLCPKHQIGGESLLVEGHIKKITCPECQSIMPFFASIADDCLDPRGFVGNEFVQVIYLICNTCKVLASYQRCD